MRGSGTRDREPEEIAWLLDDGVMCIGVLCGRLSFVAYTDSRALRFARRSDAENMIQLIAGAIGLPLTAENLAPVEHSWSYVAA